MGSRRRLVWLVFLDSIRAMTTSGSQFFKIPVHQFDLKLLPPTARVIGSDAFKDAVTMHFAAQYAAAQQAAVVFVDDDEISVLTMPESADPLDFVMTMLQGGQIKEAIPFLEALNRSTPNSVAVLYNLGIAYSEVGQLDEAIIRLKRAVQIDPSHAHAWTGIGVAYQRMGKREQALEPLRKAVQADPHDGYALRNLGAVLLSLERNEEGLEHLRRARQALPHDPQTTFGLAAALEATGRDEDQAEADELYLVVIDRWPGSQLAELAREARTKIAHKNMREAVGGGLRPDVMMYIAGALDTFEKAGAGKTRQIAFEIAMKGQTGLDINDSEQKYSLTTLPGKFSGLHLVAIMYTGFKMIDPTLDAGIDFHAEFDAAQAMRKPRQ